MTKMFRETNHSLFIMTNILDYITIKILVKLYIHYKLMVKIELRHVTLYALGCFTNDMDYIIYNVHQSEILCVND